MSATARAPAIGEVVDRAVDGELADRAAGKAQRLDDEAVARHRHRGVAEHDGRRVGEFPEHTGTGRGERRHEQPLDQRLRRLAPGAMGERDPLVPEAGPLGPRGLDDLEHPLLAAAGHRFRRGHTTSRSRANRP